MIFFRVSNPVTSERSIILASIRLSLRHEQNMLFPELEGTASMPCELRPGTSVTFWVNHRNVAARLREAGYSGTATVTLSAEDAEGKTYKGERRAKIPVDESYPGNYDEF